MPDAAQRLTPAISHRKALSWLASTTRCRTVVKARDRGRGGIGFVIADVRRLPLPKHSITGALCFGVTQALSSSTDVVEELRRCLRPGAELWIDGLNGYCLPNAWQYWRRKLRRSPMHLRYERAWALKRALRNAGLVEVRVHWMPIMPKALSRFQPLVESLAARIALKWMPPLSTLVSHAFIVTGRLPMENPS